MPASMSEEPDIEWASNQVSESKARIFYSSFFSEGVEYTLYDNVEVHSGDDNEPYIGKIIKLWEEKHSGMKKVLIRWFLRLHDLDPETEGDPKELYLAFGKGKGVTNENDLEVICGKCKVLCTSKDTRNKQPSASDLKNADFFFSKIYNVDLQHLSPVQRVVDKLGCEAVFNKQDWVTEIATDKDEQLKEPKSVSHSKAEQLKEPKLVSNLKADTLAQSAPASRPIQKDSDRDMEQKVSKGLVLKRHQAANAEDVSKTKKLKTSGSTIPSTTEAATKGLLNEEKVTSSDEVIGSKNLKVDGQEVQRKTDHTPPQPKAKSLNLEKSSSFRKTAMAAAAKVNGGEEQNKLVSADCDSPQVELKLSCVERSPSFKKPAVSEAISPKVDDVLGRAVTNSKNSRQLADMESRAKGDPSKKLKVDGKELQSKMDCTPPQLEAKSLSLEKSASFRKPAVAEAVKVYGQEEQNKLALPACAPPQMESKPFYVERSSSFQKASVSEAISPKVDDVLGRGVTNSKNSRQLVEMESLAKGDQSAREAARTSPNVDGSLATAAIESENSRQPVEMISLPKPDQSFRKAGSLDSPNTKEMIFQRDSSKGDDHHKETGEAEKSKIKRSNSTLKGKREVEVIAQINVPTVDLSLKETSKQEKVSLGPLPEPESAVMVPAIKQEAPDVIQRPKLGTGKEMENKPISPLEPLKAIEKRRIFKELPWQENLQQGLTLGKVLLLQNLDPCLTSGDVRDTLKIIFQGVSDVRIIPQETACPYGQALVIFDSRMLADSALQEMDRKCLVLASNKRPIIASKFKEATSLTRFPGHLALDKLKLSRNLGADDYKKAVSTSHSSQPNTIEYEMAMEWRRLQEITLTCRVELFEKQKREIEEVRKGCDKKGF